MAEIELNGAKYRTGKLNAWDQMHVVRRVIPVMSGLGQTYAMIPRQSTEDGEDDPSPDAETSVWKALGPVADAVSKMTDADIEHVVKLCLSKCQRFQGSNGQGVWSRVILPDGALCFDDIDLRVMMELSFLVISENLGNFFPGRRLADSAGAAPR